MKKLTVVSMMVVVVLLADMAVASPRVRFKRQFARGGWLNFFGNDIFGGTPMGGGYGRFLGWGRPSYGGGANNNYGGTDIGTLNQYNLNI